MRDGDCKSSRIASQTQQIKNHILLSLFLLYCTCQSTKNAPNSYEVYVTMVISNEIHFQKNKHQCFKPIMTTSKYFTPIQLHTALQSILQRYIHTLAISFTSIIIKVRLNNNDYKMQSKDPNTNSTEGVTGTCIPIPLRETYDSPRRRSPATKKRKYIT